MYVVGNHQTAYSDWARTVFNLHPYELLFKFNKETDVVELFHGDTVVAFYEFGKGNGFIADVQVQHSDIELGKWESFQEVDITKLLFDKNI
jgi:hypothetical protein